MTRGYLVLAPESVKLNWLEQSVDAGNSRGQGFCHSPDVSAMPCAHGLGKLPLRDKRDRLLPATYVLVLHLPHNRFFHVT